MADPFDRPPTPAATPGDGTVDRTIRNQRYRGWPASVWVIGFFLVWMPAGLVVESVADRRWQQAIGIATGLSILITFTALLTYLESRPVVRLKLGADVQAFPAGRLRMEDVRAVRFGPDEQEDYVEGRVPVPTCQVTVEGGGRRRFRLVASLGDAVRLREWAEHRGVPVDDPHGLAARVRM